MVTIFCGLLALVVSGAAWAAPLSFSWEGKVSWTLPGPELALTSLLSLNWTLYGWEWGAAASYEEGEWKSLTFHGSGGAHLFSFSSAMTFDPEDLTFQSLVLRLKTEFMEIKAEGVARLEGRGLGWGLTIIGPKGGLIERVRLRFNLKRFLDEVLENTFSPSFSFGDVWFQFNLPCCVERVRAWLSFTRGGFSELGLILPLPLPQASGLSFSIVSRFKADEKDALLVPTMIYKPPACVEVYLGLDWDPALWAVRGIQIYALGFHCQLGDVEVRAVKEFRPIGLVKEPYKEALLVAWDGGNCCGPTKFSAAGYFGDGGGLLGLVGLEASVEVVITREIAIGLGTDAPFSGPTSLILKWRAKL